ncbi:MAG TPA: extracellular solute-binding protein [Alphaproteobacteria bacterium]|jgi:ABC-type Fe3+ transport system substrate-binding protein
MKPSLAKFGLAAAVLPAMLFASAASLAADLPAVTKKYLQQLKLSEDILKGEEQDLAVPKAWTDGALKEGTVKIIGEWSPAEFAILNAPFAERYPSIKVVSTQASTMNARAVAPLIAFRQKQYITDIVTGFGGAVVDYKKADAFEDLKQLPGFKNQLEGVGDAEGKWAGIKMRYWCMAYNKATVKPEDLPKTWDDLLTNPIWANGNLGIGNRPQLWALMLRNAYGKQWIDDYLAKFFGTLKPQFRNEGMEAVLGMMAAGEVNGILPAAADTVKGLEAKGAPVSWHCPDPVPFLTTQIGILKGNPHNDAARLWVNWMLSREAQLAQYVAEGSPPAHKDLQIPQLTVYPDKTVGRHLVQGKEEDLPDMYATWKQYWK